MTNAEAFFFLCRCISPLNGEGDIQQGLQSEIINKQVDWDKVITIADKHFVLPLLYWMLRKREFAGIVPSDIKDLLITIYNLSRDRNDRLKNQAVDIVRLLNTIHVEPVLLKGSAALFHEVYEDLGLRTMVDMDLLVPHERMADCVSILKKAGFNSRGNINGSHYDRHQHYAPLFRIGDPGPLELHRAAVGFRHEPLLPAKEIFKKSIKIHGPDTTIRVPDPNHFILHNIIHNQFSDGGYRYGWVKLYQVYDMVSAENAFGERIDWTFISQRLKQAGYHRVLNYYITIIEKLLNQSRPPEIPCTGFSIFAWWEFQWQIKHRWARSLYMFLLYTHIRLSKIIHNPAYRHFLLNEMLNSNRRRHQMEKLKSLMKTVRS